MAVDDLAQLNIIITTPTGTQENVLGFRAKTSGATRAGLASEFDGARLTEWMSWKSNLTSCNLLVVEDIRPGTGATVVHAVSPAKVGGSSGGQLLPPQSALVQSWRTALKGRSFRGRSFHGGFMETQQDAGVWGAAMAVTASAIGDNMLARYGPAGTYADWQLVIISLISGGVKRVTPVSTPVDSFSFDLSVFTQRRRGSGAR